MKSTEDYAYGYAKGMVGMGIPDAIGLAVAIAEGDEEEAIFYSQMIGATHLTWYTAWKAVQQYDLLRHAGKNVKPINFHKVMFGVKHLTTRAAGGPVMIAAVGSMIAQREIYQMIDAEMQGAISYSRAGGFSSAKGPVITGQMPGKDDWMRYFKDLF